jgi:hypothetical protein
MPENLEINDITKSIEKNLTETPCENTGKEKRKCWTNDELELLKKLYSNGCSASEIIKNFPNRTKTSIKIQINRQIRKHNILSHTKEQREEIWSRIRLGNKNPMYGKIPKTKGYTKNTLECLKLSSIKLSKTIQEKISKGEWNHMKGSKNGMYGKKSWNNGMNKNTCKKIREAGKKCSITKRNIYKNLSAEEKEKRRQKILKSMTEKTKYKMRLSAIKRIKRDNLQGKSRNYNIKACEYLNKLNEEKGWKLQHALNGGEVEICGYFLDGYDKDRNIVVEYDEIAHEKPSTKKKDEIRQNNIINYLKCQFYRYKELDNNLIKVI